MRKTLNYLLLGLTICFCHFNLISQSHKNDSLLNLIKIGKVDTNMVINLTNFSWELYNSNLDTSIILSKQALSLSEKIHWKKGIANSLGSLGSFFCFESNYQKSLEYQLKALKIDEEIQNRNGIVRRLGNIGIVYKEQGDYNKALEYYSSALKIAEELELLVLHAQRFDNKSF